MERPRQDPLRPRYSIAAIAGLALAAVPCCPFTGIVGTFLGLTALLRIRQSGGRLRGRRLAIAAIIAGVASSVIWTTVGERFVRHQEAEYRRVMTGQVERLMEAATQGDPAEVASFWSADAAPPDDAAVEAFGREVTARYGAFDRMAIISTTRSGSILSPVMEIAGVLHFERSSPLGSARFDTKVVPGRWFAQLRLSSLVIEDATAGDLRLGKAAADPATTSPSP